MGTYTVYILKCADNSCYPGVTNDIDRRLYEQQTAINPTCYTARNRPLILIFCEHFEDINEAISFKKQIKGWTRKNKEAIINDNWDKLKELAICKNITSHTNFTKS